jgi:hypothetical protein
MKKRALTAMRTWMMWKKFLGQKAAKKATFEKKATNGNKKDTIDLEEMNTFGKIQADEHANRLKVLEVQQKLSSEKIEQA